MMWEIILLGRRVGLLIGRGQKRMSKEQIMLCFLGPIGYVQFVIHIELYKLRICSFSIFYKIFKLKHKRYISYHFFQFSKNLMNHMMSLPALQVQNGFLYNTHKATWSSSCLPFCPQFASLFPLPHNAPHWSSHFSSHIPNLFLSQGICTCSVLCLMILPDPSLCLFLILQPSIKISLQNCFPDCLPSVPHPTPLSSHSPCLGSVSIFYKGPDSKNSSLCRPGGLGHNDSKFPS